MNPLLASSIENANHGPKMSGTSATVGGQVRLGGNELERFEHFEQIFIELAARYGAKKRQYPSLVPIDVLERTDYFLSFPQHASFVSNLPRDKEYLSKFVGSLKKGTRVAELVASTGRPPEYVLSSAVCYHAYNELENQRLNSGSEVLFTAQGRCFRHEVDDFALLERQLEFNMREIIFVGSEDYVKDLRTRLLHDTVEIARTHNFGFDVHVASDPFFGTVEGKGRALMQRAKDLKYELVVALDGATPKPLAIASFNLHEDFFGRTFGITLPDGRPAWTGCAAFGLERWVRAEMVKGEFRA